MINIFMRIGQDGIWKKQFSVVLSRGLKWVNKTQAKKVYYFTLTNEKTVCFIYHSKLKFKEPTEIFQASEIKL